MTPAAFDQPYAGLAAATAAGLLIGLERGWRQRLAHAGGRVAGIRTFGLIGLTGGLAGLLPTGLAAATGIPLGLVIVAGYLATIRRDDLSATAAVAALLTFALGACAVRLGAAIALAAAAIAMFLLSARDTSHAWLRGMDEIEIEGAARYALVALVVLPLLPDRNIGPFDAWNPRRIWMVVVLVTGLSFAAFVISRRYARNRGLLLMTAAGALISSTAVTLHLARQLATRTATSAPLTAAISLASLVSIVRLAVLTTLLVPRAASAFAIALAPAALLCGAVSLLYYRSDGAAQADLTPRNPLGFRPAIGLAATVAILSVLVRWFLSHHPGSSQNLLLGLAGLADVDAALVTLANTPERLLGSSAATAILAVAIVGNALVKAAITVAIARNRAGLVAASPLLSTAILTSVMAGLLTHQV